MARKTKQVHIDAEGRDRGKLFVITEMSARQAEKWAMRAMSALGKAGIDVPEEAMQQGAAAILSAGAISFMSIGWADAEPLLDEMEACIQIARDPKHPDFLTPIGEDEPEEVVTRLRLRAEVIELHTGFSVADALSTLGAAAKRRLSAIPTSPPTSGQSSAAA